MSLYGRRDSCTTRTVDQYMMVIYAPLSSHYQWRYKVESLQRHCPAVLSYKGKAVSEFIVRSQVQTKGRLSKDIVQPCGPGRTKPFWNYLTFEYP